MNFSQLLSKLDAIGAPTTLSEAATKTDKPWTDQAGKEHTGTAVKGDKYTGKEADSSDPGRKSYGNQSRYAKYAVPDEIEEGAKPDFLDLDKDGDKKEPMKSAAKEKVKEDDMEEGNEFSGELAKAKAQHKDTFKVGGKEYHVKEATSADLMKRWTGIFEAEEKCSTCGEVHTGECGEKCNECGMWESKCSCDHSNKEEVAEAEEKQAPAKKSEREVELPSGAKVKATTVQGWQSQKGDKEANKEKKSTFKESQLNEFVEDAESGMSINTTIDTRTGKKTININADGESADELMQMLKMAGIGHDGAHQAEPEAAAEPTMADHIKVISVPLAQQDGGFDFGGAGEQEHEVEEAYANEPEPETQPVDTQMHQGNDLNSEKAQHKHGYRNGDNPMAMRKHNEMREADELAKLERSLFEELATIKITKAK